MTLRREQIEAIRNPLVERFAESMVTALKPVFELRSCPIGNTEIRAFVDQGIHETRSMGVVTGKSISTVLLYSAEFGHDPEHPIPDRFLPVLTSSRLNEPGKVAAIETICSRAGSRAFSAEAGS